MSNIFKRMLVKLAFLSCLAMLVPMSVSLADTQSTALYGTPELGANDPLWEKTMEHSIERSTIPDDPRPKATGTARILWDEDYLYARVVVEDSDVYVGNGPDHEYDSVEFFVGPGDNGSNQWRVSATGILSGQTAQGRAAWTELTETGYIVEMRIPKRDLTLEEGLFTFEVNINNSTSAGRDRYEVVSSFGTPDSGFGSHASFENSLTLINADEADERFSITATAGQGGTISPNAPGNVLRVVKGKSITFDFTPERGMILDTVTVDNEEVNVTDNTYILENINADHTIHATFKNDSDASVLDFIVWNDNFAKGEYTTALIIDLGEGNATKGSDLTPDMFTVSARNTSLDGSAVTFEGTRKISRVYANDEPSVRGYSGPVANSPDYQDGLESGRYIVVEFEFYNLTGGLTTLDGSSNSTLQNYRIAQNEDIILTEGSVLDHLVFEQKDVVNPILDKFTTGNHNTFNYAQYLHTDGNGEVVQELPLYIYAHGSTRGGANAEIDQKAAMKSANGAVALMKKMDENPDKFASHVLNVSSSSGHPAAEDFKFIVDQLIEDGLVDPNRIYMSGFSMGAGYTNTIMSTYPGMLAAAAPLAGGNGPSAADNEAHLNTAYWALINSADHSFLVEGVESFVAEGGGFYTLDKALVTIFETNEVFVWPYNQYDQPDQRPPMEGYVGHEIEAAVLYNMVNEPDHDWSIAPGYGTLDSRFGYLLDWIFAQSLEGEIVEDPEPTDPEPVDPDVIKDLENAIQDLLDRLDQLEDERAAEAEKYAETIAELRAEIEALKAIETELADEIADLLARVEALENRVSELEEELDEQGEPDGEDPEPVDPESEDPKPTDPEPTEPGPTESESTKTDSSNKLPATATNYFNMLVIGLTLLIVGTLWAVIVRKKKQKYS